MKKKSLLMLLLILTLNFSTCQDDNLAELIFTEYNFVTIDSTYPALNQTGIARNSPITITFSQAIDQPTFNSSFSLTLDGVVKPLSEFAITWSTDGKSVTLINPTPILADTRLYNMRMTSSVLRSTTGNPMQEDYFSTFVTGNFQDVTPPNLGTYTVKSTPDVVGGAISGATISPVNGVEFQFDDTMVTSSVVGAFSFTANGAPVAPSSTTWSAAGGNLNDTVLFAFNTVPAGVTCIINLTNAALDKGGNPLSNPIVNLTFSTGALTGADSYEYNDVSGSYTPINVGTSYFANVYPTTDVDWYRVNLAVGTYKFRLENLAADYDIELHFPVGNVVASSTNGTLTNELINNYAAGAAGNYYLRVFAKNGTDFSLTTYSLLVESVTGDAYDTGDDIATGANALAAGTTVTDHNLYLNSDVDYYQVSLDSTRVYKIDLTNFAAGTDYYFEIRYSPADTVWQAVNTAGTETLTFSPPSTANYYIVVRSSSGSSNTFYNLSIIDAGSVDYSVGSLTLSSPTPYYEQDNTVTGFFQVQNIGTVVGTDRAWNIYTSADGTTPNSASIASGTTGLIAASGSSVFGYSGTWPVGSNTDTFLIVVIASAAGDPTGNDVTNTVVAISVIPTPSVTATDNVYPNFVRLTGYAVFGATGYNIYRQDYSGGPYVLIATTISTSYDDYTSGAKVNHSYRVAAYRSAGATSAQSTAEPGSRQGILVFWDDFEDGSATDTWTLYGGTYSYWNAQTTTVYAGTYSLRLTGGMNGQKNGITRNMGAGGITPTYISYYARSSSTTKDEANFKFFDATDTQMPVALFYGTDGNIHVYGASQTYAYTANTWYQVELRNIDWTAQTYDIYVDGTIVKVNDTFNAVSPTLGNLYLTNWSSTGDAWYDNIEMRQ